MDSSDHQIRAAAGLAIQKLVRNRCTNVVDWPEIAAGFEFRGQKIHFATKAAGIFKPRELSDGAALSIRQVQPSRPGRASIYDDRELADGTVIYKLQRSGEGSHFNKYILAAHYQKTPLIFFRGIADATYEIYYPVFIAEIDQEKLEASIEIDVPPENNLASDTRIEEPINRNYSHGVRKTRIHQRAFRQRVLFAYGLRCALTGLPIQNLLEAAHIIPDSRDGEASVHNGIAMSTFHHAAYEGNLMGIDADGKIHLSDEIRDTRDGPMFDHGLLRLDGGTIRFPKFVGHRPSRDFLAERFEEFRRKQ